MNISNLLGKAAAIGLIAFALAVTVFTPDTYASADVATAPMGCTGGASADDAWCCACNDQFCGEVRHGGVWNCPHSGACETIIPCQIGF